MHEENIYVKKKSGALEDWNSDKIAIAISKSAERIVAPLSDEEIGEIISLVEKKAFMSSNNVIPVENVHSYVEMALKEVRPDVAESYMNYRNFRKGFQRLLDDASHEAQEVLSRGDKSNSNQDSALTSTKGAIIRDIFLKLLQKGYYFNADEIKAMAEGYIYVHDLAQRLIAAVNCCLFDISKVLSGGFEMGNIWYNEPKSLDVAFDVIGDIVLCASSQQYGGFTIPEVDTILEPYAEKSYQKYYKQNIERYHCKREEAERFATADVIRDLEQGFQGWEYKFNTVASSRGDYPFITVSFGLNNSKWGVEICKAILKVRQNGQGKAGRKRPVLFPKLVFLYDKNLHGKGCAMEEVFEAGVTCSSKTMYPDWLSLTGEGYVADMYKKYGLAISPMGCRAFLSPWYENGGMTPADKDDKPVFIGRFNVGAVSLNLPMILAKSRRAGTNFYDELNYYMEMIRKIHLRTYDYIGNMYASVNSLGFCEGGFYGGNLRFDQKIKESPVLLKSATASFGITALNELQELYNGKSIAEDGQFCLEVMQWINAKLEEYKHEDGHLYAVYGTPAESLCGKQVEQFRKEFGIISKVSDRPYVSNSFHCHVTEDISPITKQNLENRFWNYFNGGKIQYCRYPLSYNVESMRTLILRAMDMGFYEGVNLSLAYCEDCGHQQLEMNVCPKCGSRNLTKIDRMNGYLSYSRVHGDTRLNDAKMAEIAERKSM